MKIKAVIFDLFETIVDFSHDEYFNAVENIAGCVGADKDFFIRSWQDNWHDMENGSFSLTRDFIMHVSLSCGVQADRHKLIKAAFIHYEIEKSLLKARVMAIRVLEFIKKAHLKTGMITNCPLETPLLWPDTELSGFIDVPVFSCTEKLRKPDARLFQICADRLYLRTDECVFIGDGANDELAAAASAGMTPVLLNNGCAVSLKRVSQFSGIILSSLIDIPQMLSL